MNRLRRDGGEGCVQSESEYQFSTSAAAQAQSKLDPIDAFVPWASPTEKALRRRIQLAQAASAARAVRSKHGRAREIFWWMNQLASDWIYRAAKAEDLKDVIAALSRAFLVANAVERLETPDAER